MCLKICQFKEKFILAAHMFYDFPVLFINIFFK